MWCKKELKQENRSWRVLSRSTRSDGIMHNVREKVERETEFTLADMQKDRGALGYDGLGDAERRRAEMGSTKSECARRCVCRVRDPGLEIWIIIMQARRVAGEGGDAA